MPRNEDGEFELILGNRQLLSVFFIVVILLGVFFTMGYIVGRNSSPLTADSRRPDKPLVVDSHRPTPSGTTADAPVPAPAVETKPPVTTPPVEEKAVPAKKEAEVPAKKEPPKVEEKPSKRSTAVPDQPAPGEQYLQIAAVAKAEAQLFIDVLAKKGFHALFAPVPDKPDTFRVLVGPYRDSAAVAQAREDLEKAGFQGRKALPRKY